ncbi:hypothetical protein KSC_046680 [Ktedonobacter sp. SOSP1-52]|nr:hypothetical protein KSC_046680 [Ktedonobacter sp. SOSP1-52]
MLYTLLRGRSGKHIFITHDPAKSVMHIMGYPCFMRRDMTEEQALQSLIIGRLKGLLKHWKTCWGLGVQGHEERGQHQGDRAQ